MMYEEAHAPLCSLQRKPWEQDNQTEACFREMPNRLLLEGLVRKGTAALEHMLGSRTRILLPAWP